MGPVDGDAGDDSEEVDHVDGVDVRVIANVRGFLCGQFVPFPLQINQFIHCNEGIQFDEVD